MTKAIPYLKGRLTKELGLRYAPDIKFLKDNSLDLIKGYEEQQKKYIEEANQEETDRQQRDNGMPSGVLEEMSRPLIGMLKYLKIFKTLSPGEKQAFLS